jgi:MFS family permease
MSSVAALSIFVGLFPEERVRNKYFGIFMAATASGLALGNVLGGVLTNTLGWRSVLFVHAPVALAIIIPGARLMKGQPTTNKALKIDLAGGLTITAGLIALVYALTNAASYGLASSATLGPLLVALLIFAVFGIVERFEKTPILPPSFWSNRGVVLANGLCLLFGATAGFSVLLTIHFQNELGYSATQASIAFLPVPGTVFVSGIWIAARVLNALGPRKTLFVCLAVSLVGALILTQYARGWAWLAPGMIVFALGASFEFGAINAIALGNARPGEEGLASGVVNTTFRVGIPLGLAILVVIAKLASPDRLEGGIQAAFVGVVAMIAISFVLAFMIPRPAVEAAAAPASAPSAEMQPAARRTSARTRRMEPDRSQRGRFGISRRRAETDGPAVSE